MANDDTHEKRQQLVHNYLRRYIQMRLPVIPCQGKQPLLKGWQNRGVPTEEEMDDWISKWPDLNIGLVLGTASGIVGTDVDGKEAEKRLKEVSQGELPHTWGFLTPGDGKRYLYKLPKGVTAKKYIETLEGEHSELAFLGDGQQTILPPSVHPNGGIYKWFTGKNPVGCELAPAPQWMLNLMAGGGKPKPPAKQKDVSVTDEEASEVFNRLTSRCKKMKEFLNTQQQEGLPEETWFRCVSLLVNAGHPEEARAFSKLSAKHDDRSEERLDALIAQVAGGSGPMTRCTTFGCDDENIEKCFPRVNENDDGQIINSPGSYIQDMEAILPPSDPIYLPYLKALETVSEYDIDEGGHLCGYDRKGNPFAVANFLARPTMEVIRDDGVSEDRTFRIEGVLHGGRPLSPVDISAADFPGMNWPIKHWGIGASIRAGMGNKEKCRDAIQNMAVDLVQHRIFTHLGWRKLGDDRWVYLHAGGCIGAENITVEVERVLKRYRMPGSVSDRKKAASASLGLLDLAPREITIALNALVYLAPLVEPFKQAGLEPNFLVWLFGGTGTRKTSLGMVYLSHFCGMVGKSPPASFKDTANALERRGFATKDTLLLVDDYHPEFSKYEDQKMTHIAQRLLRMYGDRVPRGRLKSTIEFQKEYPPRGMALVTGEDIPQGQSSVARFMGLEILQGDVDLNLLTEAQNNAHIFGEAMVGYIQWLLPQMNTLPQQLAEKFQAKRVEFQQDTDHGRLGEAVTWLYLAYEMMLEYMLYAKACSGEEAKELLAEAEIALVALVQKQGKLVNQEKPAEIFMRVLQELFATGKVRVDPLKPVVTHNENFATGDKIGWRDDKIYYLMPEATYNAVTKFLYGRGEIFPVKDRTLWKHLDEAQLILTEVDKNGNLQRCPKKTIPTRDKGQKQNQRPRLLHLYSSSLITAVDE